MHNIMEPRENHSNRTGHRKQLSEIPKQLLQALDYHSPFLLVTRHMIDKFLVLSNQSSVIALLAAKLTSRFLLPISSRQIDESISIADFFPPNFDVCASPNRWEESKERGTSNEHNSNEHNTNTATHARQAGSGAKHGRRRRTNLSR